MARVSPAGAVGSKEEAVLRDGKVMGARNSYAYAPRGVSERGPNSLGQSKSIQLERALRSLSPVGRFATPLVLVATHEERPDHPLQDMLPFQASFQVPTCAGGLSLSASLQVCKSGDSGSRPERNGYGEGLSETATGRRRHFSSLL